MKRILTFFLALGLLASMGSSAFAEEGQGSYEWLTEAKPSYEEGIPVSGTYNPAPDETPVYRVTIEWGDLTFNYNSTGGVFWDTTALQWVNDGESLKLDGSNYKTITVVNHSNAPVLITPSFKLGDDQQGSSLQGSFPYLTDGTLEIDRCEEKQNGNQENIVFVLSGTPLKSIERDKPVTIGTLTLTVSDPEAA